MPEKINIYALGIKTKQKEDLLGIYQHYLHFEKTLELILNRSTPDLLPYIFMNRMEWDLKNGIEPPWRLDPTTKKEQEEYTKFVNGEISEPDKFTYMSLYYTNPENDAKHPEQGIFPEAFDFLTIDLDLPCLVERYAAACPKDQKLKDAAIIIDGKNKARYIGSKFSDMKISEALKNHNVQQEFRVLFNLVDHYERNAYDIERKADVAAYMTKIMKKIMTEEILSDFENRIIDLLGTYADKTQEIMYKFFPKKSAKEVWQAAEKENLIKSAEMMTHYLNIRHLVRHQWDTLEGKGKSTFGENQENENLRSEYVRSYFQIFDKTLVERIKAYQKASVHMQSLLKIVYPEFIARDEGESNSKFVQRLKDLQRQNPDMIPLVCVNYPLNSEKQIALTNSIRKVIPKAQILDITDEDKWKDASEMEAGYSYRSWFLQEYNHLESEISTYCFTHGVTLKRGEVWDYLKKSILSPQEYDTWLSYCQLRNNLSHNHLSEELREEIVNAVTDGFDENVNKLKEKLRLNTPCFTRLKDGTYSAVHKDGSTIIVDMKERKIISHRDKNGKNLLERKKCKPNVAASPVKVSCQEKEVVDCRLGNGVYINLRRKKVCLPDDTRIYLDAKDFNVFCFENGDKIFTDKNFVISKYIKQGRRLDFERNETCFVAPSHRMSTDYKGRISEECSVSSDGQKVSVKFNHSNRGATLVFSDGTMLDASNDNLIISHNGTILTPKNRFAFLESYLPESPTPPQKLKDISQGR